MIWRGSFLPFSAGFFATLPAPNPDEISTELEKEGRGNAQKGVYLKQLAKYKVKIPSFKCQNKFCEIYNQADKSKYIN